MSNSAFFRKFDIICFSGNRFFLAVLLPGFDHLPAVIFIQVPKIDAIMQGF